MNTIANIRNYYVIDASTGTAGQPTQEQFHAVKDVGYEVVINLSKENTELGWPVDERYIVTSLEMTYAHIPVDFDQPTSFDFRTFAFVMDCFCCKRVFIHCLANKRVSVFMFLYRVMRRRVPVAQARSDLLAVWKPNDVWQGFIDNELSGVGLTTNEGPASSLDQHNTRRCVDLTCASPECPYEADERRSVLRT